MQINKVSFGYCNRHIHSSIVLILRIENFINYQIVSLEASDTTISKKKKKKT